MGLCTIGLRQLVRRFPDHLQASSATADLPTRAPLTVAAAIAGADSSRKSSTADTAKEASVALRTGVRATYHPRPCEAPDPRKRVLVSEETKPTTTESELRILFGGLPHLEKRL